ncbi:MAG: UDP-N-acetylmuramoyl-L-alanine--D-glutamate ligase [Sandarakinorhabdus sp.]|nr:UDP-N-acetylmuramoyl-L-alanine--D-glutamate ligase [Sandarakinorhabdus sp.]
MLAAPILLGRRYGVYGLARTGLSVLRFLARSGAAAVAWDESPEARAAAAGEFPNLRMEDFAGLDLSALDGIVVSPGVPLNRHPLAARAREAAVPVLGDIELFQMARAGLPPHRVVGITGTNGKSTTTALLHHLLAAAGRVARLGGNIGLPILDQAPLPAGGVYVLELSSFQIDLCASLACDIAIYTNLSPDHLDRYDSIAAYAAAKERLFAMQSPGAQAVIAIDDEWTRSAAARLPAGVKLTRVSAVDVAAHDQARWPALQGPHNAQNVACAAAAARLLGVGERALEAGLRSFPGLAHRMEIVSDIGGVRYVNDSKATNPTSVAPALRAFPAIHWILGGQAKSAELDACLPYIGSVKAAYVIGEAAPIYADILRPLVPVIEAGTVERAVSAAAAAAVRGDTVLLSPACASYDQFRDFEARGAAFREAVRRMVA